MDDNGVREWPRGHGAAGDENRPLVPLLPLSRFNERLIGGCIVCWRWLQASARRESTVALLVSLIYAHIILCLTVRAITQIALIDKRAPIILIFVV